MAFQLGRAPLADRALEAYPEGRARMADERARHAAALARLLDALS